MKTGEMWCAVCTNTFPEEDAMIPLDPRILNPIQEYKCPICGDEVDVIPMVKCDICNKIMPEGVKHRCVSTRKAT